MALTINFLRHNFRVFNEKYFDNELVEPQFRITHVKSYLGLYSYRRNIFDYIIYSVISISDFFDRSDEDVLNTLAHEMIHLYIAQNNIKDTRPHHGEVFYRIADRLNKEGNFHIARADNIKGIGLRDKSAKNCFYVCCYKTDKYNFRFVMNQRRINNYYEHLKRRPNYFKEFYIFKSYDDVTYASFRKCRRVIHGEHIDNVEYESLKNNNVLMYSNFIEKRA